MSEIKNDAMALRNRPLIKGVLAHQIEECIASAASVRPSLKEFIVNCSDSFRTNFCTRHATLRSGQEGSSDPDYRQSVEPSWPDRSVACLVQKLVRKESLQFTMNSLSDGLTLAAEAMHSSIWCARTPFMSGRFRSAIASFFISDISRHSIGIY